MGFFAKNAVLAILCAALTACGYFPRGAPVENEILKEADEPNADFAVYPVTRAFLPSLASWPRNDVPRLGWINGTPGSAAQVIRPGDALNLQIWDSGENSLLTSPEQRVASLEGVRVSESGTIFVPYVGKVQVSGRTPDGARLIIQRQLEAIVPDAQVQLGMQEGRSNSIDLVGGVRSPGTIILPDQNFSVLAAISASGGVSPELSNPQVKIVRGSNIYGTSVDRLYDNPSLDTRLRGGDKVIVEEDERYFLSLGAASKQAQHFFNRDEVSALDAIAIIGGVNAARANPQGILVLREYSASAISPGTRGPRQRRVVFTLDITSSDGLFSARKFLIQSGDLVLATESPVSNIRSIFSLLGSAFVLVNATRNATE